MEEDPTLKFSINYYQPNPPNRCTKRFLNASDILLSLFVITPLVVTHWRGTWAYIDFQPGYFPPWNCFIFGAILHTIIALLREILYDKFEESKITNTSRAANIFRHIFKKMYAYIFSMACNMHWRGGWAILDVHYGIEFWPVLIMSIICFIVLVIFKSVRNLVAPPVVIIRDTKEFAFAFPTRFRMEASHEPGLYILDCFFSVLVIGTLVVFVWRGMWVICDLTIYPDDKVMSAWGSVIIGYGIVAITFALQSIMRWACDRLQGIWRVAAADIFLFFSFVGTVNVWRGVWGVTDLYFLPDYKLLGDVITHSVSFLLLALLNCSNSVLVRGVYIDAEEPAGQCVIFPVYYIRLFFQKERTKKQKRLLDALEKMDHNKTTLLSERSGKTAIIIKNNINSTKAIELTAMLDEIDNINEKTDNGDHIIRRSSE